MLTGDDKVLPSTGTALHASRIASEERLLPVVRATLARKLAKRGFRVSEIARALKVTHAAVAQYLGGKRGASAQRMLNLDTLVEPLAEKLSERIRRGASVETVELLEAARQAMVMSTGQALAGRASTKARDEASLDLLRGRLRLELDAAEKYLALANRTSDEYTKLLFRMIAADSIRHGDVVSQLISWLESGGTGSGSIPEESVLKSVVALEDSAGEESLMKEVDVDHPVAQLLLRWIDIDESKHDRMVRGLMTLSARTRRLRMKAE